MGLLDKLLHAGEGRIVKNLEKIARQVNSIEPDYEAMDDDELRGQTALLRERHENGESLDDLLPEAFATVREATNRVLGKRPFDVQIMGGAALHQCNIAEMKTGEGKTIVALAPSYLNALAGRGVHVVTVNDYLAKSQSDQMGRVHHFLGLETGVILSQMSPAERRKAYGADITYGTNNEFGFDYLRDNMALSLDECVQRDHYFAIVDEVDSILVDEARTPLIISGPADDTHEWYPEFARIARALRREEHYEVDEKKRTVAIREDGIAFVEDRLGIENLYESANTPLIGYLNNAIKAKELFKRDKDYVVIKGEVLIVDEHTGRTLEGRRYNEGLHQALEAKEGVEIKDEYQTLATITLQNYFRMYDKLSGMTGTAKTEESEFQKIYGLGVIPIPTNRPMIRKDQKDLIYRTEDAKFAAIVDDIVERHEKGQPVLIGTASVEKSEKLSELLAKARVPHQVLNAKQHAREAAIVAMAGRKGAVTVATNMAGRGTDIMLGGNAEFLADLRLREQGLDPRETPEDYEEAWPEALAKVEEEVAAEKEEVTQAGGLYVVGSERHESRRIDNQLRGRSGRQGDPGESRFYLSLGDDLLRLFKADWVNATLQMLKVPDDVPIDSKAVSNAILSAQKQLEAQNFEMRKNVLKYDDVMNRQRHAIYGDRRAVLEGADVEAKLRETASKVVEAAVHQATAEGFVEDWDLEALWTQLRTLYPVSLDIDDYEGATAKELTEDFQADIQRAYDEREQELGEDAMRELERRVLLTVLDRKWREHLYEMEYLKEGIGLRAMAQRDPLVEYQREGGLMFNAMMQAFMEEVVGFLFNLEVEVEQPAVGVQTLTPEQAEALGMKHGGPNDLLTMDDIRAQLAGEAEEGGEVAEETSVEDSPAAPKLKAKGLETPKRPTELNYSAPDEQGETQVSREATGIEDPYKGVGRNAPCPCGSGKKFKQCHGR